MYAAQILKETLVKSKITEIIRISCIFYYIILKEIIVNPFLLQSRQIRSVELWLKLHYGHW